MFFFLNNTKNEKDDIYRRITVIDKILWGTNKVNDGPYFGKAYRYTKLVLFPLGTNLLFDNPLAGINNIAGHQRLYLSRVDDNSKIAVSMHETLGIHWPNNLCYSQLKFI